MVRSDQEADVESWLEEKDLENAWELAPSLVAMGLYKENLEAIELKCSPDAFITIINHAGHLFPLYSLLHEIREGSGRISQIVIALKNYSYLGQAPVQEVNIHEGIDNTLVILRSKLKAGITVHREYCNNVPIITAYGSELNQVWTNLLDNAIDAMHEKGEITIRTKNEKNYVMVEIEDNGPGIPPAIQSKIFDPFLLQKSQVGALALGFQPHGELLQKNIREALAWNQYQDVLNLL